MTGDSGENKLPKGKNKKMVPFQRDGSFLFNLRNYTYNMGYIRVYSRMLNVTYLLFSIALNAFTLKLTNTGSFFISLAFKLNI